SLGIPEPPMAKTDGSLGCNLDTARQVFGIVFRLLRVGERKKRAFEPDGVGPLESRAGRYARAEHFKRAALMQEKSADTEVYFLTRWPTGWENVRGDRWVGVCWRCSRRQRKDNQKKEPMPSHPHTDSVLQ